MVKSYLIMAIKRISRHKWLISQIRKYFIKLEDTTAVLAKMAMLVMMTVVFVNVIGRYIFSSPLTDTIDYVELYLMPMTIFLYMSSLDRRGGNVGINIIRRKMTAKSKQLVDIFISVATIAVFYLVLTSAFEQSMNAFERGQTTGVHDTLPTWITWMVIAVGIALLLARLFINIASILYEMIAESQLFNTEKIHD